MTPEENTNPIIEENTTEEIMGQPEEITGEPTPEEIPELVQGIPNEEVDVQLETTIEPIDAEATIDTTEYVWQYEFIKDEAEEETPAKEETEKLDEELGANSSEDEEPKSAVAISASNPANIDIHYVPRRNEKEQPKNDSPIVLARNGRDPKENIKR